MSDADNSRPGGPAKEPEEKEPRTWQSVAASVAKGITGLAGLGGALVAIFAWFPMARDTLWPNLKEYEIVSSLHAGYSVDAFDAVLGPPSIVMEREDDGTTKRLYVKDNYVVQTVALPSKQTVLYSVLSCDLGFQPTFTKFGKSITLNVASMAAQSTGSNGPDAPVKLYYAAQDEVGIMNAEKFHWRVEVLSEDTDGSQSRGIGFGVNTVCTAAGQPATTVNYQGPLDEAPEEVKNFRAATAPNFYVETYAWSFPTSALRQVSPYYQDLPTLTVAAGS
ncbi:ETEC_3214 domain-containing protein [Arthrobacter sp. D1-17]